MLDASAAAAGDAEALLEVDRRCHEIIWNAAGNRFLTDTLDMLYAQSDRLWHMYLADVADTRHVVDEHRRSSPRCVDGDGERAARSDRVAHARLQRQDRRRRAPPARIPPRRLLTRGSVRPPAGLCQLK